jgi:addiction module HigA family antidote
MRTTGNGMRPIHPGEVLREEYLAPLDMSVNALAKALRVDATRMNEIVRERRRITPDTAERLARYFSSSANSGSICRASTI